MPMIFVDPKTGKEYKTIIDAARALICPGPCIDCTLRPLVSQGGQVPIADGCILWAYDHPTAFAERMGLVIRDSSREDMTLGEVRELCMKRQAEFHDGACQACFLYDPAKGDCVLCTQYVKHQTPADWELYTGLQFPDFNDRKWLNGIYDVYGPQLTIRRYSEKSLVAIKSEAKTYPLPPECLSRLPVGTGFSLDEARKNKYMFVSLMLNESEKAPDRQPSFGPTLRPDAGKENEFTDERGMLDLNKCHQCQQPTQIQQDQQEEQ